VSEERNVSSRPSGWWYLVAACSALEFAFVPFVDGIHLGVAICFGVFFALVCLMETRK
jgi:hypothetical protein